MATQNESANATEVTADAAQATNAVEEAAACTEEEGKGIPIAIEKARSALEDLKTKLIEYDEQFKASESASVYLKSAIEQAQSAFDKLSTQAAVLKDKTAEVPTKALSSAFATANVALEQVSALATKYDERFQLSTRVAAAVEVPRHRAVTALSEASDLTCSLATAAAAQLQGVNQGIRQRALSIASSQASFIFNQAAALNERFDIESKAISAGTVVADKASALDERYNVKDNVTSLAAKGIEKAQGLDSRVTGGKLTPAVQSAFEQGLQLATGGLALVQAGYGSAKQQRTAGGAAAAIEQQRAESCGEEAVAEPPKANEPDGAYACEAKRQVAK
jgi:hypothetical protein